MGFSPEPIETEVAAQANVLGWQSVSDLIDQQTLRASWQECRKRLMKVACNLDNSLPLLESLADARKDDIFRHRLCLAAHCAAAAKAHEALRAMAETESYDRAVVTPMIRLLSEVERRASRKWWFTREAAGARFIECSRVPKGCRIP